MKRQFKLLACLLVVIAMVFTLASCDLINKILGKEPAHEHNFVEGKCDCGEVDPNYEAPHEHKYVDGKCECGAEDPDYEAPHEHKYVDGKCECGAEDPNYVAPTPTPSNYTVYLLNQAGWEKVCVYYWAGADSNGWPGTELTVGEDGLYKVDIDTKYGNLIFNNSNGGTGNQTEDLKAPTDTNVVYDNVENKWITYEEALKILASTPTQNVINVTTTDTYSWVDEVTFTAAGEGNYTFTLPAGLGAWEKSACDAWPVVVGPYVDFNDNVDGATFTVGLEAEATLEFYVGAFNKADWEITWTYEECDVDNGGDQPGSDVPGDTLVLNVGANTVVFADGELSQGKTYTFTVTEAGTYTFNGDLTAVVADAEGNTLGRGQVSLTAGTYNVTLFSMMPMPTNSFTINITVEVAGGEEEEPDGSEENPYVWNTIPESATANCDEINKYFYTFTAAANGTLTLTYPVVNNSWWTLTDKTDGSLSTQGSGENYTATLVEGHVYVLGLGVWAAETTDPTVTLTFVEGESSVIDPDTCEHSYYRNYYHEYAEYATCTTPGVAVFECEICGYFYSEETAIDPTNHDYVTNMETYVAPTCVSDGWREATCSRCNDHQTYDLPSADYGYHDMVVEEEKLPTCTEPGIYKGYCKTGGCNYSVNETSPATGHWCPGVTCGNSGVCFNCGENFTQQHEVTPTCSEGAYCSICNQTLEALGHNYVDGICSVCEAEDPDHYFVMSITDALAAADGKKVQVSGTVCAINTAWSDSYGNISVTITDANGGELYLYRLATNVALGDIITVKGAMATYNGRQIGAGATAEITGHDTSYDYVEMSITDALAADDNTNVIVTGTVVKIGTAYSSQYGNISVYIADDDGNQLYLYRLTGNVTVGQIIKVKGAMATYSGSRQIAGGTFEAVGTHTCSKYTEATCTKLSACVVCGATTGELEAHNYVDGACSVCGAAEGVTVTVSTLEFTETNMTSFDVAAGSVWEANDVKYTNTQGSYTNALAKYNAPARIYAGTESTIECKGMTKIVFNVNSGKAVDGLTGALTDTANYTVDVNGFVVTVTFNAPTDSLTFTATAQFRLDSIEVTH